MTKYMLGCDCGKTTPVDTGQAGGQIQCSCGATLDVPTLRRLRELPAVAPAVQAEAGGWSFRRGAVAACVVLAGLLVIGSAWSRWSEPRPPRFEPLERDRLVDGQIDRLTPVNSWWVWVDVLRPLSESGFAPMNYRLTLAQQEQIARGRFLQAVMLVLAAVCAVGAVVVGVWPAARPVPRRH